MRNKSFRIPTRDAEFNIYQWDVRNYLNTEISGITPAVTGGGSGGIPGIAPIAVAPVPMLNWQRLGVTAEEMANINRLGSQWEATYPLSKERHTRTPALVEEKSEIKNEFVSLIRPVLGRIEKSPNITITDRNALHLPKRDFIPTRRARITESPFVKIFSLDDGMLKIRVRVNEDSSRASMQPLADAVELRYKIGGNAPNSVDDCASSEMSKKAIFFLKTGHAHATKKIWCYLRWVNLSAPEQSGPFGTLAQAVIL